MMFTLIVVKYTFSIIYSVIYYRECIFNIVLTYNIIFTYWKFLYLKFLIIHCLL